jgi:glycosyltransferase involved in cell wall biosynthesis
MHQRGARFAAAGEAPALAITRDEEAAALARFDAAIAIQPTEAAELRAMLPARMVVTAGMAPPLHAPADEPAGDGLVLFIGGASPANIRAARRLLAEIWPRVCQKDCPPATLTLVGDVVSALASDPLPPGVRLAGYAPDLDAVYAAAHVIVNPVDIGGGLKIKNVEALCHAKPLVTTPLGAEGLEDGAGTAFLVADTPAAFAAHVARLLGDASERRELSRCAHAYAAENFGAARVYGELLKLIEGARGASPSARPAVHLPQLADAPGHENWFRAGL